MEDIEVLKLTRVEKIHGHPWIRAVAEIEVHGIRLRGIKLEEHREGWRVTPPGRRVQGCWQSLFSFADRQLETALLETLRLRHG